MQISFGGLANENPAIKYYVYARAGRSFKLIDFTLLLFIRQTVAAPPDSAYINTF